MSGNESTIAQRLQLVRSRIEKACWAANRDPAAVRLIAVSKFHDLSAVEQAYEAGQRHFGESYAQELEQKAELAQHLDAISFHFIGHLQRNKAKRVVRAADSVDSVDSLRLADALSRHAQSEGKAPLRTLVQWNTAAEQSKSGVVSRAEMATLIEAVSRLEGLELAGIMTLPPQDLEQAREAFRLTAELGAYYQLPTLSMGMSGDLEIAIAQGSTEVRVGTAIFGPRPAVGS